jgi:hypothetical protein
MEILEAFDLTGSYRAAAELAGCDITPSLGMSPPARPARSPPTRRPGPCWWTPTGPSWRSGWTAAAASCAPMSPTTSWWRWATRGRSAPPAGRWLLPSGPGGPAGGGSTGLGARAGHVVAVGLRQRADGRRAGDLAVLRLAGVEPVAGGAADLRQGPAERGRLPGHHAAPLGRGADLRADRQREDGHRGARGPHSGRQSRDGGRCWPLRLDDRDLPARRPEAKGGWEAAVRIAEADLVQPRRTCSATTSGWLIWSAPARSSASR